MNRRVQLGLIVVILVGLGIGAYALSRGDKKTTQPSSGSTPAGDTALTPVTLFMSYVPSVQFAPIYVAYERGYFAEAGIDLKFENSFNENDGVERIAANNLQFGLISGEQVVLARSAGRPIVYVFEWYHNFPVGIVSRADRNLTQPEDLRGLVVGVPGPFGASYIGLRALLKAADLQESDLGELRSIGFTAVENVCQNLVDASVVYIANEPLTIEQDCFPVNVIKVSDYTTLVSNGLVTNETTIKDHPELVRGMTQAIQRGIADVLADPDAAFTICLKYVTDLPEDQRDTQKQVLMNSIELWRSDGTLGETNPAAWEATQDILIEAGLQRDPLDDLSAAYDMSFLPK